MYIDIRSTRNIESKLQCVKIIKELTGHGLKESKEIMDYICDRVGNNKTIHIEYYDAHLIEKLRGLGVSTTDDREDNIDEVLMDFRLLIPSDNIEYRINDGEYSIEGNLLIVKINDGKFSLGDRPSRSIIDATLKIDFRKCIIEDYD